MIYKSILLSAAFMLQASAVNAAPVKYILDTDIASDCDDAGAVAVANALADRGEVEILAMMVSTGGDYGAPALDAINTYYRRPDIPIGTLKQPDFWDGGGYNEPRGPYNFEKYNRYLAENFPNDLKNGKNAPDATVLYRRILASQPDGSVVINSIGPLINLARLLESRADSYSSLNGRDLVRRKVKMLVVTGGRNPTGSSSNFSKGTTEIYTKPVIDNWPSRMVFVGNEVGGTVDVGFASNEVNTRGNPARKAFEIWLGDYTLRRDAWDQVGVLYSIRGLSSVFGIVENGHQTCDTKGTTTWSTASSTKDHAYITRVASRSATQAIIEGLMTQTRRSTSTPPPPTTSTAGLLAYYYSGTSLTSQVASNRVSQIDFAFGYGAPVSALANDNFSVRYEGYFRAPHSSGTKEYEFIVTVNDGARVYINGTRIIDAWYAGPLKSASARVTLAAGVLHPIVVEYFENTHTSTIRLEYQASGLTRQVVPASRFFITD